jgi:hypothetical protein
MSPKPPPADGPNAPIDDAVESLAYALVPDVFARVYDLTQNPLFAWAALEAATARGCGLPPSVAAYLARIASWVLRDEQAEPGARRTKRPHYEREAFAALGFAAGSGKGTPIYERNRLRAVIAERNQLASAWLRQMSEWKDEVTSALAPAQREKELRRKLRARDETYARFVGRAVTGARVGFVGVRDADTPAPPTLRGTARSLGWTRDRVRRGVIEPDPDTFPESPIDEFYAAASAVVAEQLRDPRHGVISDVVLMDALYSSCHDELEALLGLVHEQP